MHLAVALGAVVVEGATLQALRDDLVRVRVRVRVRVSVSIRVSVRVRVIPPC